MAMVAMVEAYTGGLGEAVAAPDNDDEADTGGPLSPAHQALEQAVGDQVFNIIIIHIISIIIIHIIIITGIIIIFHNINIHIIVFDCFFASMTLAFSSRRISSTLGSRSGGSLETLTEALTLHMFEKSENCVDIKKK